jgi:uncharacterized protein DUF2019
MTRNRLCDLSDLELVQRFRGYALDQEAALWDSDTKRYTRLQDKIDLVDAELRARGPIARKSLLVLLHDENMRVRYEAARRCLGFARESAVNALNEIIASDSMPEAGWAGMTLENFAIGRFKPT